MENTQNNQGSQYKRTSRHPSEETKERISQSLRGRPKDFQWRQAISMGMVRYWADDEHFPDDNPRQGESGNGWLD